ncbi:MAG: DUF58 domain-containing protein [Planctomycetota bacterium]
MPIPSRAARRAGERFQLAPRFRGRGGLPGERSGRGVGSSLEFQDRRAYTVGDDVRHLDWRAYARTDLLLVKQYEEELRPRLELFLDCSRSLAVEDEKAALAVDLTAVLVEAGRRTGFETLLFALDDEPRAVDATVFLEEGLTADATLPFPEALGRAGGRLRTGSLRIVISDFLVPFAPESLFAPVARTAGRLALIQVLGATDVAPPRDTEQRLIDAESGASLERRIDEGARQRYLERFARWNHELETEARRLGATWVSAVVGPAIEAQVHEQLVPAGLLE